MKEGPPALLVIGIHREELAFGRSVAGSLDRGRVAVLEIPEGLSGARPLPDQLFRYEALHQALYLQLLPHARGHYALLIDLHTGFDSQGPSADLITADVNLQRCLHKALAGASGERVRVIPLGTGGALATRTVIPELIWHNPDFAYVGIELYLPDGRAGWTRALALARKVIEMILACRAPAAVARP
ncbi:MAG TPA: hypothetical protein PLR02_12965 [Rhodocyclaceae bacterium]|nr:hypothetical protein [Rhodocyclaceae bacterium]